MYWPISISKTEHQTAMPSGIFRIFLYYHTFIDDILDFLCRDHPLWSKHLSHRMGQIKHLAACCRTHSHEDIAVFSAYRHRIYLNMRNQEEHNLLCEEITALHSYSDNQPSKGNFLWMFKLITPDNRDLAKKWDFP